MVAAFRGVWHRNRATLGRLGELGMLRSSEVRENPFRHVSPSRLLSREKYRLVSSPSIRGFRHSTLLGFSRDATYVWGWRRVVRAIRRPRVPAGVAQPSPSFSVTSAQGPAGQGPEPPVCGELHARETREARGARGHSLGLPPPRDTDPGGLGAPAPHGPGDGRVPGLSLQLRLSRPAPVLVAMGDEGLAARPYRTPDTRL